MSMTTMKGFVPKDRPMLPGETKVFSRLGYMPPATSALKNLEDVTRNMQPLTKNCLARPLDLTGTMDRTNPESLVTPSMMDAGE
jgi:hypothetical protein